MPIANCFLKEKYFDQSVFDALTEDWSIEIGVSLEDITINWMSVNNQSGKSYEAIIHLYLPTVWSEDQVAKIQLSLSKQIAKHFDLDSKQVFIMTSVIKSGHVVSNGEVEKW
ncbi:MAG: hypothetical protein ABJN36_02950 [Cyclobacteriaceae bacterium]